VRDERQGKVKGATVRGNARCRSTITIFRPAMYPSTEPFNTAQLKVSDLHSI